MLTLDLFAGPGGWDVGGRDLGLDPLGIEWDDAACRTRKAAGLRTLQGDVAQGHPTSLCDTWLGGLPDLLIGSPPCQAWSMAGKRGGGTGHRACLRVHPRAGCRVGYAGRPCRTV